MSDGEQVQVGTIGWRDLTVPNAEEIRDFYKDVVGWESTAVDMGEYSDFNMIAPATDQAIAGICHARGGNAEFPPQWMLYIVVEDIDRSIEKCVALGGEVVVGPKSMGAARYCVIRDPAGAVSALYQP